LITNNADIELKSREIFLSLGFSLVQINGHSVYEFEGNYYMFSFVSGLNGFVIESALSLSDAKKNLYEDSDLIPIDKDEEDFLITLKDLLIKYYV